MKTDTHTTGPWRVEDWNRLISAAPEMLAALESLAVGLSPSSVDMQRENENLADLCRVCREIAENALAKVKGGDA